jgi:hypothetical protein
MKKGTPVGFYCLCPVCGNVLQVPKDKLAELYKCLKCGWNKPPDVEPAPPPKRRFNYRRDG